MAGFPRNRLSRENERIRIAAESGLAPFPGTTGSDRDRRRERALSEFFFFAQTYFPHHLTEAPSQMHLELYRRFQEIVLRSESTGRGAREVHAAPRGNAKSTIATLILPLWCIAGKRRRFIGVLSDTTEQAEEFLECIKAELEANERLKEDFPDACSRGRTWKSGQIVTQNGVKVKCWGKRKRLRGARHGSRRPDLIVCDDLEDDENIHSPDQREKDRQWFFKAVMKIGGRYTAYLVIGTILHYDSLLARLLKQPGWRARKWQAVIRWSPSALWETWETLFVEEGEEAADRFFSDHRAAMLADTEVLWPQGEPYEYLMKMRVADGPAYFDSEKQNEPIHPGERLFQEDWFAFLEEGEDGCPRLHPDDVVIGAVDPSMGHLSRKSDPSAIVIAAVRGDGRIDILEADIRKRHPDRIMEDLFALHRVYGFDRLIVEEVQFQELFKDHLVREGARRGVYLPVEGVRPHADKILRISKLQPYIKSGLIRFRKNQKLLLDQLRYFPKADHDDGPDALEMVFSAAAQAGGGPRIRRVA